MISALQGFLRAVTAVVTPWIVLAPWESGLRIRLGKNVVLLRPGFNWVIPGIDRVCVQTNRLRVSMMQMQTMSTRDGRTLILSANISYAIEDIRRLYDSLHHAEDTIKSIAAEAVAEAVLSVADPTPMSVTEYATNKLVRLNGYGLRDVSLCLTDFAFVRVYRLVSDQKWGGIGDQLNTSSLSSASQAPR